MSLPDFFISRIGLFGIGLIVFGVIAIASLSLVTSGGEHPLALESEVDLCGLLGEDTWLKLQYPASDAVIRVPADAIQDVPVCAMELDPVPANDRWARVARGNDADQVRRVATVMLTTTTILRRQSPDLKTYAYTQAFDQELVASGWLGHSVEGPWRLANIYSLGEDRTAALIEDYGVMLWTTATGVAPENLESFARAAAEILRTPTGD